MEKTFRISIRVKNCKEVFKEGLEPGVLGFVEVTYSDLPEGEIPTLLVADLMDKARDLKNDLVEDFIEEV